MNQRIVVMGGSFNPPTVAHQRLLLSALDAVQADLGIFVPSSHEYVQKKMTKANRPTEVLDEALRLRMLCRMSQEDPRLCVDDHEYHLTEKSRTYHTMEYLQEKYPDAELLFLAGGDKMDIFPRWYRIRDFLERFRIVVTSRADYDAEAALEENPFLHTYRDRFVIIDYPDGIDGISSSAVREKWRVGDHDGAREMLHAAVYEWMLDPSQVVINLFRGEHYFLSNFYESPLTYRGVTYQNAEAAFQAQKCVTEEEKHAFASLSPSHAKNLGRQVTLRADWEDVKVGLMEEIVRAKFTENEEMRALLLSTGDAVLKEGNTWHDTFWGVDSKTGKGENHLGRILMKVRLELQARQDAL